MNRLTKTGLVNLLLQSWRQRLPRPLAGPLASVDPPWRFKVKTLHTVPSSRLVILISLHP